LLDSLRRTQGLALSGIENDEIKQELDTAMHRAAPDLASAYSYCNDVLGSVATASPNGTR